MVNIRRKPLIIVMIVMLMSACSVVISDMDAGHELLSDEGHPLYLEREIPPCIPIPGSRRDPCAVRRSPDLPSDAFTPLYLDIPTYWDLYYDPEDLPSIFAPHLVIRATFLPDTTRCASFRDELPVFTDVSLTNIEYLVTCVIDAQVNEYMIGTGPSVLSIAAHVYPFLYVEDDSLEWIDKHRQSAGEAFEGREGVLFLAPSSTTAVKVWWMTEFWDVQESGDTVSVVAPYKEDIEENYRDRFTEEELALLESWETPPVVAR